MEQKTSIQFVEESPPPPSVLSSLSEGGVVGGGERSVRLAKMFAGIFALLLVIVIPIGMLSGKAGMLARSEQSPGFLVSPPDNFPPMESNSRSLTTKETPGDIAGQPSDTSVHSTTSNIAGEQSVNKMLVSVRREMLAYRAQTSTFSGYVVPPTFSIKDTSGCTLTPIVQMDPTQQKFIIIMTNACGNKRYYCIDSTSSGVVALLLSDIDASRVSGQCVSSIPASSELGGATDQSDIVLRVSDLIRRYAVECRGGGGVVFSGFSGQALCDRGSASLVWPAVSFCGSLPTDTKWTVFHGDTDNWDVTVSCAARPECNGPSNALCTKNGCTFSKACLPG